MFKLSLFKVKQYKHQIKIPHIENTRLICNVNRLTGFYMWGRRSFAFNVKFAYIHHKFQHIVGLLLITLNKHLLVA